MIRFTKDTDGIFKENWKRKGLNKLLKRFGKQEASTEDTRAAERSTRMLKKTRPLDELVGLLRQEDQTQIYRSTRQVSSETSLTVQPRRSFATIRRWSARSLFFVYQNTCFPLLLVFSFIFSQGSVATQLRCSGIFASTKCYSERLFRLRRRYVQKCGGTLFMHGPRCINVSCLDCVRISRCLSMER